MERQPCKLPDNIKQAVGVVKGCLINAKNINSCNEIMDKEMRKAGAEFVGWGLDRRVYGFNGCVIKVARTTMNRPANIVEKKIYDEADPSIKEFFAPVEDADEEDFWITMPRAVVNELHSSDREVMARELRQELDKRGWGCVDLKWNNVGLLDEKPKITNYGMGLNRCFIRQRGPKGY